MLKRIVTAAVALAVFIVVLLLPPAVFTAALAVVIILMLYECSTATKASTPMRIAGLLTSAAAIAVIFGMGGNMGLGEIDPRDRGDAFLQMCGPLAAVITAGITLHMALIVFEHGKRDYKEVLANLALMLYITLSASCIWLMREMYSTTLMLLIFVSAWSCDTFAYFTGRFLGKHKLIPHVSPNKTVEGAIGGVIGAMVGCFLFCAIGMAVTETGFSGLFSTNMITVCALTGAVYGLVGGACSQIGDLTMSAVKRDTGIKDFGWIFPGHGGFLDRFDSVIFIAPILFAITVLWQGL